MYSYGRNIVLSQARVAVTQVGRSSAGLTFSCKSEQNEEPTSGLELLCCSSYECAVRRCRGLPRVAKPVYLSRILFPVLLHVALYCAPGGVRVVSISRLYPCDTGTPSRPRRDARLAKQSRLSGWKPPGRGRGPGGIEPVLCRLPSRFDSHQFCQR